MPTTPRGYPYPGPTDPNDVPGDLEALAQEIDGSPGIAVLTTAERNALGGAELWTGRTIYNATTNQPELYKAGAWAAITPPPKVDVFTTSGTWTKPAGTNYIDVLVWGGGGGGTSNGGNFRTGGGGGGFVRQRLYGADIPDTQSVIVGAGGAGSTGTGGTGGTSSFGNVSVTGGGGGAGSLSGAGGGTDGAARHDTSSLAANNGGHGGGSGGVISPGGDSTFGGGGGSGTNGTFRAGGTSTFGGNGGGSDQPGIPPGGGGSAPLSTSNPGSNGARGEVRVISYF